MRINSPLRLISDGRGAARQELPPHQVLGPGKRKLRQNFKRPAICGVFSVSRPRPGWKACARGGWHGGRRHDVHGAARFSRFRLPSLLPAAICAGLVAPYSSKRNLVATTTGSSKNTADRLPPAAVPTRLNQRRGGRALHADMIFAHVLGAM